MAPDQVIEKGGQYHQHGQRETDTEERYERIERMPQQYFPGDFDVVQ
jgi:hypothetical protein